MQVPIRNTEGRYVTARKKLPAILSRDFAGFGKGEFEYLDCSLIDDVGDENKASSSVGVFPVTLMPFTEITTSP